MARKLRNQERHPRRFIFARLALLCAGTLMVASCASTDWRRAGYDHYEAQPWIEVGLTPEEATWWRSVLEPQLYLTRTEDNWARIAGIFTSNGLTTRLAQNWFSEFGDQLIYYEDGRFGPSNYYSATHEFTAAAEYLEQGLTLDEAKLWRSVYISPSEVTQWQRAGLSPADARRELMSNLVYERHCSGGLPADRPLIDSINKIHTGDDVGQLAEAA